MHQGHPHDLQVAGMPLHTEVSVKKYHALKKRKGKYCKGCKKRSTEIMFVSKRWCRNCYPKRIEINQEKRIINNRKKKTKKKKQYTHKEVYDIYISSVAWKAFATLIKSERGDKCEICEAGIRLTIHHKTYKSLFKEEREDLIVLCWECHKKQHPNKRQ